MTTPTTTPMTTPTPAMSADGPAAPGGPLAGTTVLDLSSVGPAARATRVLADYGATVVKVGPVPRDGAVQIVPPPYAYSGHRGMQRVLLDLKAPAGREAFLRLAARADVVIESFRPGVVDRLGIGYDDVRSVRPDIVYCSTSGYGQHGPYRAWAGHDLNYLALAGFLDCTERGAGGKPPIPGATIADSAGGGMHAAMAILAALVGRASTGTGAYLDVAVADGVLAMMALAVDEYLATDVEPGPGHGILTGRYACYDTYRCRDDRWVAVAAIEPVFYANLCRLLGCDRWVDHQLDDASQDAVRADFRAAFATRDRDDWVATLAPNDTCVSPVYSVAEVVHDPHLRARGAIVDATDGTARFRQLGTLLAGTDTGRTEWAVRDPLATDTVALLGAAGFTSSEIDALIHEGAAA